MLSTINESTTNEPSPNVLPLRPTQTPQALQLPRSEKEVPELLHGQKLEDYDDLGEIGRGQFGSVHRVRYKKSPNVEMVWKALNYEKMPPGERRQLTQEVQLLQTLRHPGIVRFVAKIHDPKSSLLYLIMEFCEGGDLGRYLDHTVRKGFLIPEDTLLIWFAQLVDALHYCHTLPSGQVFHRDIKPQNVLLCQDFKIVKLADFGLAKMLSPQQVLTQTQVGTPYYMSPEVLNRYQYDAKSDVWSLGCLLYEMATGNSPHANACTFEGLKSLVEAGNLAPLPSTYTKEFFSLIKWMLAKRAPARPSTTDLRKTLAFRLGCMLHYAEATADLDTKKRQADQVVKILKNKLSAAKKEAEDVAASLLSQKQETAGVRRSLLEEKALSKRLKAEVTSLQERLLNQTHASKPAAHYRSASVDLSRRGTETVVGPPPQSTPVRAIEKVPFSSISLQGRLPIRTPLPPRPTQPMSMRLQPRDGVGTPLAQNRPHTMEVGRRLGQNEAPWRTYSQKFSDSRHASSENVEAAQLGGQKNTNYRLNTEALRR